MFFFGYEAGGLCSLDVAYCIADEDGNLVSEQWFEQPYCSTIHDFVITEKYAIFPIFPTLADLDRLKAGGAHWAHHQDLPSYLGHHAALWRRVGDVWIKGPIGVSVLPRGQRLSTMATLVHIDLCLTDTNAFAFMREAGGITARSRNPGRADPLDARHEQGRTRARGAAARPAGRPCRGWPMPTRAGLTTAPGT